jgi:hypothetical protein
MVKEVMKSQSTRHRAIQFDFFDGRLTIPLPSVPRVFDSAGISNCGARPSPTDVAERLEDYAWKITVVIAMIIICLPVLPHLICPDLLTLSRRDLVEIQCPLKFSSMKG